MKKYNKLVRDRIPEILAKQGQNPVTRILDNNEYVEGLMDKLCEEVDEFDEDRNVEEMADILEVLMALASALGISQQDLRKVREKKALTRGGFKKRILLERIEE
jgi:predicted house-cleaning noncanonical NTP pyrophosphatase (MazG superfamily)